MNWLRAWPFVCSWPDLALGPTWQPGQSVLHLSSVRASAANDLAALLVAAVMCRLPQRGPRPGPGPSPGPHPQPPVVSLLFCILFVIYRLGADGFSGL